MVKRLSYDQYEDLHKLVRRYSDTLSDQEFFFSGNTDQAHMLEAILNDYSRSCGAEVTEHHLTKVCKKLGVKIGWKKKTRAKKPKEKSTDAYPPRASLFTDVDINAIFLAVFNLHVELGEPIPKPLACLRDKLLDAKINRR